METSTAIATAVLVTASAPGFAPVPNALYDDERIEDPTTLAVYGALARFIDYGTGICYPSLITIGKKARVSQETVKRHITILVELGYVEKRRTGRTNTYHLVNAWGRQVTGDLSDSAPVTLKRDLVNEKRAESETGDLVRAPSPSETTTDAPVNPREDPLVGTETPAPNIMQRVTEVSNAHQLGTTWIGPGVRKDFEELERSGFDTSCLIAIFDYAAVQAPGRVRFFTKDFPEWKAAYEKRTKEKVGAVRYQCFDCGSVVQATGDGEEYACLTCRTFGTIHGGVFTKAADAVDFEEGAELIAAAGARFRASASKEAAATLETTVP